MKRLIKNLIIVIVYSGLLIKGIGISNLKINSSKFFNSCNLSKFDKLHKLRINEFNNFSFNRYSLSY